MPAARCARCTMRLLCIAGPAAHFRGTLPAYFSALRKHACTRRNPLPAPHLAPPTPRLPPPCWHPPWPGAEPWRELAAFSTQVALEPDLSKEAVWAIARCKETFYRRFRQVGFWDFISYVLLGRCVCERESVRARVCGRSKHLLKQFAAAPMLLQGAQHF